MKSEETIVIDPVGMNIVNRIAPGTKSTGTLECSGGLLVQGHFEGTLVVSDGPLVLMQGGVISGDFDCKQDAYLFGTIAQKPGGEQSQLTVGGAAFMADTLEAKADITAGVFKTYEGAQVDGRIRTGRKDRA
ncbi:bactofilin family protein [Polaromonas aquatica]|uniref:Polymer-forming cytoskeletal protein n=1 Tax=Polaromonas aquatica TaxID=332657 RepID=A0ABW1TWB2_9BURK